MATRQELIRQATARARRSWLAYTVTQEVEIARILEAAAARIIAQIERAQRAGKVPPASLMFLIGNPKNPAPDSILGVMREVRPQLARRITRGMRQSVWWGIDASVGAMQVAEIGAAYNIGLSPVVQTRIIGSAMDALVRAKPQGLIFSDRVWDVTWQAQKAMRLQVARTVATGQSAASLSRDIRGFLSEPDKLFRRVRRDGRLVLSKAARDYHPGVGTYRSAYKNAIRLARTEMTQAYHEGSVRYMQTKKWIDGAIWRTVSGEPCEICLELDGVFFEKGDIPPIPHPHCYCHVEPHFAKDEQPQKRKDFSPDTRAAIATA